MSKATQEMDQGRAIIQQINQLIQKKGLAMGMGVLDDVEARFEKALEDLREYRRELINKHNLNKG